MVSTGLIVSLVKGAVAGKAPVVFWQLHGSWLATERGEQLLAHTLSLAETALRVCAVASVCVTTDAAFAVMAAPSTGLAAGTWTLGTAGATGEVCLAGTGLTWLLIGAFIWEETWALITLFSGDLGGKKFAVFEPEAHLHGFSAATPKGWQALVHQP